MTKTAIVADKRYYNTPSVAEAMEGKGGDINAKD